MTAAQIKRVLRMRQDWLFGRAAPDVALMIEYSDEAIMQARADARAGVVAWLRHPAQRDANAQQVASALARDIEQRWPTRRKEAAAMRALATAIQKLEQGTCADDVAADRKVEPKP